MAASVGAGVIGGAIGGGLAVTVLAPLTAANNFLGSYFFGSGMILGERQMYQDDWIKIKKRLDAGESFLVILEEVMKPNTQAVMQMARETVIAVSAEWNKIVLDYVQSIPESIWNALKGLTGQDFENLWPLGPGIVGIVNGKVTCADGWHSINNDTACMEDTPSGPTVQTPFTKSKNIPKTTQQIVQQHKQVVKHIQVVTKDPLMVQFTTFLADLSKLNQLIQGLIRQIANKQFPNKPSKDRTKLINLQAAQKTLKLKFNNFKKNNKRWGSANNLF